jgi:hypothetical protein
MIWFSRGCSPGWRLAAGLAVAWLIACAGCGMGGPTAPGSGSIEEATVHGKVTIKGVPARGGRIYFDPTNASRQSAPVASAEIGKDGTYTVKTWVGENRVNVETPETRKDPDLSIPQPFEVKSGDNTLDVTLPHP